MNKVIWVKTVVKVICISDILETIIDNRRIVIWGISVFGLELGLLLKDKGLDELLFYADNDKKKQNAIYCGNRCISSDSVREDDIVFLSVKSRESRYSIIKQLTKLNVHDIYSFSPTEMQEYSEADDDIRYLRALWRIRMGYDIDFQNPKTFNEKLQWLKIYDRNPLYTNLVDKVKVKEWVSKKIGENHIIKTLGIWEKPEKIDFEILPDQFVIKCNHNSGNGMTICRNKEKEKEEIIKKLSEGLSEDYYSYFREWPYKDVEKRIIAEEFLGDNDGKGLNDYKFLCFNGQVQCSFVVSERYSESGMKVDFYDKEWNRMPFIREYPASANGIDKPLNYDEMVIYAQRLSEGIPFVRVDFYEVDGRVYFGEMTFFPGAGFEKFTPNEYDTVLGEWLHTPTL